MRTLAPAPLFRVFSSALFLAMALMGMTSAHAAQWKWRDASGVVHYSDQPPPANIPASNILQRPATNVAVPAVASHSASQPQASNELEKKIAEQKKAEQAAQEQAKLQQQQAQALVNQQNCLQAQKQLQVLDSGQRMVQVDAQGQRVIMDDAQRAAERAKIAGLISQYCR